MKHLFAFVVLALCCAFQQTHATDVSGSIATNTTWTAANSPYVVTGTITVASGFTLTIQNGVSVMFTDNTGIIVDGSINATNVSFNSNAATKKKGDWGAIQIGDYYNTGTGVFNGCSFTFGGKNSQGMLYVYRGNVSLTNNCNVSNSANGGVVIEENGSVSMSSTTISSTVWPVIFRGKGSLSTGLGISFAGNTHDAVYIEFYALSGSWSIPKVSVPYVFYSDFYVNEGANFTIPGSVVLKSPGRIIVNGTLKAVAPQDENIVFTSSDNDNVGGDTNADGAASTPHRGSWGGIWFGNTSVDAQCMLKRCTVSFGGSGYHGGVVTENASPTIDSCLFTDNYYGVEFSGISKPVFRYNTLASSQVVPIAMSFDSDPVMSENVFSFSDNQYDAIGLLGGTIGADSKVIKRDVTGLPNVTYLLLGSLTIPDGYKLTIDPGVVIKSPGQYTIEVNGTLLADGGNAAGEIVFTSAKDDTHGNPKDTNKDGTQSNPGSSDWGGILFQNSSNDAGCKLNYCQIKYATMYGHWYTNQWVYGGAVTTENASPAITNCIIKDVTYGIYAFQTSNPTISNCEITNAGRTPIAMSVSANPTLANLTFTNVGYTALGLIGEIVGNNGVVKKRNVAGFNNISYVLLGDITINSGTNVMVEPGIVVKAENGNAIFVDGGFKSVGLSNDSITFTSVHDDNYGNPKDTRSDGNAQSPQAGNWGGLRFRATSDDAWSGIDYCNFFYGGSSNGVLIFTDANTRVKNTLISDGYGNGMRFEGTSAPDCTVGIVIKNCKNSPLAMSLTSDPVVSFTSPMFASLGNANNGIKIIEGDLAVNASLKKRDVGGIYNVAYIVDNLKILPNATLTIGPDVVIKFSEYYHGIEVRGALKADGGASATPIVFTSIHDDSKGGDTNDNGNSTSPQKGNWSNISFYGSALDASNLLRYCIINYGGNIIYWDNDYKNNGSVRSYDSKLKIENCRIEHANSSALGIYGSSTANISNTEINNTESTPVTMSMFSNPVFTNITGSNLGIFALGIARENYSVDATMPIRNFAGFTNISYYFFSPSVVNSGTHITIPKGMVFKTNNTGVLDVSGRLTVAGTADEPVVFTHVTDDNYGKPADSQSNGSANMPENYSASAIVFQDVSQDVSSISNAVFRYFENGVVLMQAAPAITGCLFEKCNWGVVLDGVSTPSLTNSRFNDLKYCPMKLSLVSYPSVSTGNTISGKTFKSIGVLSEELVRDATLEKRNFGGIDNISYFFSGNYTIGTSAQLIVKPGVVCKFNDWAKLTVKRSLLAIGGSTPDSTIVFTDWRDDFYAGDTNSDSTATSPGGYSYRWSGIFFDDVSLDNLCQLKHCVVRYAGYWAQNNDAAVTTTAASPSILYSSISNSTNGIVLNGASNPLINYCDIYKTENFGVNNINQSFNVNATQCWWGDNTGPTHASNPNGKGSKVSDKVVYNPYRSTNSQNPMVGDVSLNGTIQAYDASLTLQHAVGLITLPSLQKKVADVSGDGTVSAFDASLILRFVAGLDDVFPAEMKSAHSNAEQPLVFGKIRYGAAGVLILPILANGANNALSFELKAHFNADVLHVVSAEIGSALTGNGMLQYHVDGDSLAIAIASSGGFGGTGEVARINIRILNLSEYATLVLNAMKVNERSYEPVAGMSEISFYNSASSIEMVSLTQPALLPAYPNPAHGAFIVSFRVPDNRYKAIVAVYDVTGKLVVQPINGFYKTGEYAVRINELNDAGLYFIKLTYGNGVYTQMVSVVK